MQKYRKSCCSTPGIGVGGGIGGTVGASKLLTLLHSEWPKLCRVLAILSAKGLKFRLKFLYDGQDAVRRAILYADWSCCLLSQWGSTLKEEFAIEGKFFPLSVVPFTERFYHPGWQTGSKL